VGNAKRTEGRESVDAIGNALHMRVATGKIEKNCEANDGKDPVAKALGKKGAIGGREATASRIIG
jgi:hypothetical protein